MAIIQISKIQQRSGNLVDLPQLDEAQLGWANDAKRLFIGATGNVTTDVENVEVLTSYSTISFSQVEGSDGSNVNITSLLPGQILGYDANTNSWVNTGGNTDVPNDPGAGIPIHLGTVSNVKIAGGASGYILETDGAGNLSWSSKGTLRTPIIGLSNATPIVMTVSNTTPYTNGLEITITGANTSNSNIVNGQSFYIQLDANFSANSNVVGCGNVTLFTSPDLAPANAVSGTGLNTPNVYIVNSGIATVSLSGGSASTPGGGNAQIQFNDAGILNGSANFIITGGNIVTLTGNFSANNVAGGNLVSANYLGGILTTAAQPNITSTGTLSGIVVAGNITPSANITYNLGNNTNRFNDLYLANSTIYIGNQTISANASSVIVSGNLVANITGNVSGNVTTAGTVTDAAQPNITSVGTLTSLSVSGNANIGNIGTVGLITATGNISGANIVGTHYGAATGLTSIPGANVTGEVSYASTANAVAGANVSGAVSYATTANAVAVANVSGIGNIATINKDGNASNILYGNGVFASAPTPGVSYGNSNVATFLASYGSNTITTTGNISAGNIVLSNASIISANNMQLTTGANTNAGNITGNWTLTSGSKLEATYADLAEYYEADKHYTPGTVLEFGGEKEVTLAQDGTTRVAGVVSTNPAYAMNANCKGIATAIALQGRVPTKVRGTIHKGDMLVSAGNGYARPWNNPAMGTVLGKALENFEGIDGVIEVAIGRL